jgi:hypothetical protein
MSYTSAENQTLLWNTIQKIPLLHDQIPTYQQEDWFKQIIGMFYQKNQDTQYDLRQLNKETIGYMIRSLKPEIPTEEYTPKFDVERAIKQLQEDVALLKKLISEPKEVAE